MSATQLAEFNLEASALLNDSERMFTEFSIRFWRQKAWRAEQQRDREIEARKQLENKLERFKRIPQALVDSLISQSLMEELSAIKKKVEHFIPTIGSISWERYLSEEARLDNIEDRIHLWKEVLTIYSRSSESDDDGD